MSHSSVEKLWSLTRLSLFFDNFTRLFKKKSLSSIDRVAKVTVATTPDAVRLSLRLGLVAIRSKQLLEAIVGVFEANRLLAPG